MEEALRKAYRSTVGGKPPNTLLVGPKKGILSTKEIDLKKILHQWEGYKEDGIVYNPKDLDPKTHGGQTEAEMLSSLTGVEKETGGVLRLERDRLIMPKDVGKTTMSPRNWHTALKGKKTLPLQVRAQDAKQALAYIIHCLNTQGWIPDYYDYKDEANSRIALAPETYMSNESSAGAVPAFYWLIYYGRFRADRFIADYQFSYYGVRGGVRKNTEMA